RTRTNSGYSIGSTSRNHPTAPRRANTRPNTLTAGCVTSPAQSRVMPNAVTKGHAVGAGIARVPGACSFCCSAAISFLRRNRLTAGDVEHGKDDHPYRIDKMPVPPAHLEVLAVGTSHV